MDANARAAIWGSFAGDSLALGLHWIYDRATISAVTPRIDTLLPPQPGSYHPTKKAGDFTHYGDQTLLLLESLAAHGGFNPDAFAASWRQLFEGGYTGYVDRATSNTLSQLQAGWPWRDAGSASDDLAGASRIAPLAAALRQDPEAMVQACRTQTAMTHNNSKVTDAAEFFARTASAVFSGTPPREAMVQALEGRFPGSPLHAWHKAGADAAGEDSIEAIVRFGQSCHIDGAFQSTVQLIARHQETPAKALADSVMAGGDCAARNMLAGMVLCAWKGLDSIPTPWREGLAAKDVINAYLARIA